MTMTYYQQWLELKELEAEAKQRRIDCEQKIAQVLSYDFTCGKSFTTEDEGFKIQFVGRKDFKVDHEKLLEIQKQFNIPQEEINRIFTFKVEAKVNNKEFNVLPEVQKQILLNCLSETVGKPTIKINSKGE